jgi:hypothetical protein
MIGSGRWRKGGWLVGIEPDSERVIVDEVAIARCGDVIRG